MKQPIEKMFTTAKNRIKMYTELYFAIKEGRRMPNPYGYTKEKTKGEVIKDLDSSQYIDFKT